jgi:hypothetical protein
MNFGIQLHILAGICHQDFRDGALLTQIRGPVVRRWGIPNQPAFFSLAAPEIISIEKLALNTGRRSHTRLSLLE